MPRTDLVGDEPVLLVRMYGHQVSSLVTVKDQDNTRYKGGDLKQSGLQWSLVRSQIQMLLTLMPMRAEYMEDLDQ